MFRKLSQDRRRGEEMACIDGRTTAAKINYSEMRRDTFIKVYALSMDYNLNFIPVSQITYCLPHKLFYANLRSK